MVFENLLNRTGKPPISIDKWIDLYPFPGNNFWSESFTIPNRTIKGTKTHKFKF